MKGKPLFDPPHLGVGMDQEDIDRFLLLVSATKDDFRSAFGSSDSRFGFLPFETSPVLRTDAGLLVLSETGLWRRITSGLYWVVHDYVKNVRSPGTDDNLRWNEAYSEMVEMAVEDQLESMAPALLGPGTLFYTEEDM
ncbi:MAG: hypothetical protein ACRDHS_13765, partial [Actinomycetota bacterium]